MIADRHTVADGHEITVPRLHGNSSSCKIVAWLREEGDLIQRSDSILILETDKATIELEAEVSGTLTQIFKATGEWVEVNSVVGLIRR